MIVIIFASAGFPYSNALAFGMLMKFKP